MFKSNISTAVPLLSAVLLCWMLKVPCWIFFLNKVMCTFTVSSQNIGVCPCCVYFICKELAFFTSVFSNWQSSSFLPFLEHCYISRSITTNSSWSGAWNCQHKYESCRLHVCSRACAPLCTRTRHQQNMGPLIKTLLHSATCDQKLHRVPVSMLAAIMEIFHLNVGFTTGKHFLLAGRQ